MLMIVFTAFVFMGFSRASAQMEIRYINSMKIMSEVKEAVEVQKKLQDLQQKYGMELQQMQQDLQQKQKDFEAKQLVLSEENKKEKMKELQDLAANIQKFQYEKFGQGGEFYKKSQELQQPIIDKINMVMQRIAIEKGYDYILDAASDGVVFAKDIYDISNMVIEELNKTSSTGLKK
jgi:outer membrane protein